MDLKTYFARPDAPSQIEFAKKIGCSPSYLSRMVSGNRTAGPAYIGKIIKLTKGKVKVKDLNPRLVRMVRW